MFTQYISMSRRRWALLSIAALLLAAPSSAAFKPKTKNLEAGPITVSAQRITSFSRTGSSETHFGKLDFLGGLVLTAPDVPNFGGWSGLVLDPDGKSFVSISDSGVWLTGSLQYDGSSPTGIKDARIGPVLGADGKPFKRDRDNDSEAIALLNGSVQSGEVLVSFEQNTRIARYSITGDGLSAARAFLPIPKGAAAMRRSQGFEAMTVMRGGPHKAEVVAMSERLYDKSRNHTGWIWTPSGPQDFHLTNIGDFDVTDVASTDDGTLYVLERRFRWLEGVKMRLRRINAADLQPGRTVDGKILIEADLEKEIDNMEGLSVTRNLAGETIFTMISDDNFNHVLQRTVLLQFALNASETAKARPPQ